MNEHSKMVPEEKIGRFRVYIVDWDRIGSEKVVTLFSGEDEKRMQILQEVCQKFWFKTYRITAHSIGEVWDRLSGEAPPPKDYSCRSMGVGDFVMDPDGGLWLCEQVGWKLLDRVVARKLVQPEVASA